MMELVEYEYHPTVRLLRPETLHPVAGHIAVALDKLMLVWGGYVMGSEDQGELFSSPKDLLVYDTVFDKWFCFETNGEIPQENSGACAVLNGMTLYVFGGYCDKLYDYAHLYALDLRTLTWRHLEPADLVVPTVRHKLVGWHYEEKLYYFGGFGPSPEDSRPSVVHTQYLQSNPSEFVRDENMMFGGSWNGQLISFDLSTHRWELVSIVGNGPSARAAHSAVCIPTTSKVIVFGGRLQECRMNDMYLLDLPSMTWTKIETNEGPCGRSWHTTIAIDSNRILLFGGFSQGCIPLGDSWYFDIDQRRWTQLERKSVKKQRLWHTAVAIDQSCYIFGGCKTNILAMTNTVRQLANDVLVVSAAPKPLFQCCLKYVSDNRAFHEQRLAQLPSSLYEKLYFIASERRQKSVKKPTDLLYV